ncbi:hypothetical protein ONZ45_g1263 [Pleurotus djamor]|nr:hypothetical protein ONZ45_g1263 [Pleurotus djamor]
MLRVAGRRFFLPRASQTSALLRRPRSSARKLTTDAINPAILDVQYAVCGELALKAEALRVKLKGDDHGLPFSKVISTNIGNPQQKGLDQSPITFTRQIAALMEWPELAKLAPDAFPKDVIARAKQLQAEIGSVGAYSHSQGVPFIRQNVAKFIEERDGYPSNPEHIFLTGGASPGVSLLLSMLISEPHKSGVLIPIPQYPLYTATLARYQGVPIPYHLDEASDWSTSVHEVEEAIEEAHREGVHPKALVIINPGNPTGALLDESTQEALVDLCEKYSLVLLADEVYQTNLHKRDSHPFTSFKKIVAQKQSSVPLVSFHSISKGVSGECGRRGGYFECTNLSEEILALIYKMVSVDICPPIAGQIGLDAMIRPPQVGDESYPLWKKETESIHAALARRTQTMAERLNSLPGVTCVNSPGALYLYPQIVLSDKAIEAARKAGREPDVFYALQLLDDTGICVIPGSGFGQKEGEWHYRLTCLCPGVDEYVSQLEDFHKKFIERVARRALSSTRTYATPAATSKNIVNIVEVGPRDGLQNEKGSIPVDVKVELVNRLARAGLKTIEAGSFVSPKWVPQMAGTADVLSKIERTPGNHYPVLVPNQKGLDHLLALLEANNVSPPLTDEIAIFTAATDAFTKANLNTTTAESLARLAPVTEAAVKKGLRVRGYVSVVIACPYSGRVDYKKVREVSKALVDMGCYEVSLGDTVGMGTPYEIAEMIEEVKKSVPVEKLAGHFHDTYGTAVANVMAALSQGIRTIDSSVGGLGGCPYSPGATGNVATEDVLYALQNSPYHVAGTFGSEKGVNMEEVVEIGWWISEKLGRESRKRTASAAAGDSSSGPSKKQHKKEVLSKGKRINGTSKHTGGSKRRNDEELESDRTDESDAGDIDDMDLRPDSEEEASGDEYADETPAEKRLRLAKLYLESVKQNLAEGEFDAAEIDKELISARLKQDVLEHSGKVHLFIADSFDFASPPKASIRTRGHRFSVTSAVAADSGKYLFTSGKEGSINKWELSTGKKLATFYKVKATEKGKGKAVSGGDIKGHTDEVLALSMSSDGMYLVSGGKDNRVVVWDAEKGEWIKCFIGPMCHRDTVSSLAFRKGTHQLYTGSFDRTLKVFDLSPSVMGYVETLYGHQDHILNVDALRTETCVSVGARDKTVRYWKIADETQLIFRGGGKSKIRDVLEGGLGADEDDAMNVDRKGKEPQRYIEGSLECVAMIDETTFVTGGDSGSICLWNIGKKKPIFSYSLAHGLNEAPSETEGTIYTPRWITSLASLRYSDVFASGSWDGSIRLWKLDSKLKSFQPVGTLPVPGVINSLQLLSPPKTFLASASWLSNSSSTTSNGVNPSSRRQISVPDVVLVIAGVGQEHRLGRWLSIKNEGSFNGSYIAAFLPRTSS